MSAKLSFFLNDAHRLVVIGMGNELRTDDAVGIEVARRLKQKMNARLTVFDGSMLPDVFIRPACAVRPSHLLIIDAAELHGHPGEWRLLSKEEIDTGLFTTHAIPATEIAAEIQRRCHAKAAFLGIQPKSRGVGLHLSPECTNAADEIAKTIIRLINTPQK